ncbi:hypothetical protein Corgl_0924 [Coriobacterium glomerans PW2]|uniref:Uncharacterized protein n=1 Tax=Coriobacterium glomerans (strain ATCC 49209 / DSM 20642 / JCM 10262 / PW2) TaxID=700015 RepID=F2N9K6_CORGP|nr:hypothetical protein [Coriobacterium glomerans]AEB07035.1 hypothetical protein Corgl_0924 [Coriobacterium glomerans PW2]
MSDESAPAALSGSTDGKSKELKSAQKLREFWGDKNFLFGKTSTTEWREMAIENRGLLAAMHPDDIRRIEEQLKGKASEWFKRKGNEGFLYYINGFEGDVSHARLLPIDNPTVIPLQILHIRWVSGCTAFHPKAMLRPIPPHPFMGSFHKGTRIVVLGYNPQFAQRPSDAEEARLFDKDQDEVLRSFAEAKPFLPWLSSSETWRWHREELYASLCRFVCASVGTDNWNALSDWLGVRLAQIEVSGYPTHNIRRCHCEKSLRKLLNGIDRDQISEALLPSQEMALALIRDLICYTSCVFIVQPGPFKFWVKHIEKNFGECVAVHFRDRSFINTDRRNAPWKIRWDSIARWADCTDDEGKLIWSRITKEKRKHTTSTAQVKFNEAIGDELRSALAAAASSRR